MKTQRKICCVAICFILAIGMVSQFAGLHSVASAQAPAAGKGSDAKSLPPEGIEVPAADRTELERNLAALDSTIKELAASKDAKVKSLLPDVQIFSRAVQTAMQDNEFFAAADIAKAKALLKVGQTRADELRNGQPSWPKQTGLVPRGYVSKIDGSVQPFGLVVPESYLPVGQSRYRLDIWLHGRNEKLSEVNFLDERLKQAGQFTPPDTIVLHVYGRYCNAFKFAGEVDVLEAIDAVKKQYRIDDDRIAMRGFSMGGAGCWHLAVHYADRWVVATPGAGFAEYAEYLKLSPDQVAALPAWQQKLLTWYDCPNWAGNLYNCPTIAYNGEDDPQKQAADVMEKALEKEGITLKRIIGPKTKHAYHPESKKLLESDVESIVEMGRDRNPAEVHLVTYTLRYNKMAWVQVDGLAEHWTESRVDALATSADEQTVIAVDSKNVTDLTLSFPPGWTPFDISKPVQVAIDDQELDAPRRNPIALGSANCTATSTATRSARGKSGRVKPKNCGRSPAYRGRLTMPSWIRSSSCGRPVNLREPPSAAGCKPKWIGPSANGVCNFAATPG